MKKILALRILETLFITVELNPVITIGGSVLAFQTSSIGYLLSIITTFLQRGKAISVLWYTSMVLGIIGFMSASGLSVLFWKVVSWFIPGDTYFAVTPSIILLIIDWIMYFWLKKQKVARTVVSPEERVAMALGKSDD